MNYQEYLKTEDWTQKRISKLRITPNCEACKSIKNLHVHHLNYKNLYDVELADLMTLCATCHLLAHDILDVVYYNTITSAERRVIVKDAVQKARSNPHGEILPRPRPPRQFVVRPVEKLKSGKLRLERATAWSQTGGFTSSKRAIGALISPCQRTTKQSIQEKIRRLSGPCRVIYRRSD